MSFIYVITIEDWYQYEGSDTTTVGYYTDRALAEAIWINLVDEYKGEHDPFPETGRVFRELIKHKDERKDSGTTLRFDTFLANQFTDEWKEAIEEDEEDEEDEA